MNVSASATLTLTINGHAYIFDVSSGGHVKINGHVVELIASTNSQYPSSAGWMVFKFNGITFYFKMQGEKPQIVPVMEQTGTIIFLSECMWSELRVDRLCENAISKLKYLHHA